MPFRKWVTTLERVELATGWATWVPIPKRARPESMEKRGIDARLLYHSNKPILKPKT